MEGYKAYCQEYYDHNIAFSRPSNPKYLMADWFMSTKDWYDRKEKGLVEDQPVSFHYWAVDSEMMKSIMGFDASFEKYNGCAIIL